MVCLSRGAGTAVHSNRLRQARVVRWDWIAISALGEITFGYVVGIIGELLTLSSAVEYHKSKNRTIEKCVLSDSRADSGMQPPVANVFNYSFLDIYLSKPIPFNTRDFCQH